MVKQMIRAARLDRRFYTELIFDDYATGNAVLVVAAVFSVVAAGLLLQVRLSLTGVLLVILGGIIGWLVAAGGLWLAGVKLLHGSAQFQTVLRLAGFSHVPLLLIPIALFVPSPFSVLIAAVGIVWFVAGLATVAVVLFDFDLQRAAGAALISAAVWWIAQLIGIGPDLPVVFRYL